jgi:glucokinase
VKIAVGDIGGTNARFALAEVAGGKVVSLGEPYVFHAKDYDGIAGAWKAFDDALAEPLPRHAALAIAGPVTGGPVHFLNSPWVVDPSTLAADLSLDSHLLLNDFGAMAHAVQALGPEWIEHLCGPAAPLPADKAISVIGPGTGLGVAVLQRLKQGIAVLETEGAHIHFAPLDAREQQVSDAIAAKYGRTSVERVVSGPGLGDIVRTFAPQDSRNDGDLWAAALSGNEQVTCDALSLFLAAYGSAVGDLSLAHGSLGVALTGGLTNRMKHLIPASRFHARFRDKGRYRERMESIPILLVTHPQPGLYGAAAAFAAQNQLGEHPE